SDVDLQDEVIRLQVLELGDGERGLTCAARLLLVDVVAREVAALSDVVARGRRRRALVGDDRGRLAYDLLRRRGLVRADRVIEVRIRVVDHVVLRLDAGPRGIRGDSRRVLRRRSRRGLARRNGGFLIDALREQGRLVEGLLREVVERL